MTIHTWPRRSDKCYTLCVLVGTEQSIVGLLAVRSGPKDLRLASGEVAILSLISPYRSLSETT